MSDHAPSFQFVSRPAHTPLSSAVDRLWYADGAVSYTEEKILPNGRAVIIFNLGDAFLLECAGDERVQRLETAWLCGPQTRYMVNRPTGRTRMIGATLRPLGLSVLVGGPADAFTDRVTLLDELWPGLTFSLRERLAEASSPGAALDILEQFLTAALRNASARHEFCARAVIHLCARRPPRVQALCAELEISRKHLGHLVRAECGLSPSTLIRLSRFRHFLDALWRSRDTDFARLAGEAGYYDQPHMNRDFRSIAGVSPTEYIRTLKHEFGEEASAEDNRLFVPQI